MEFSTSFSSSSTASPLPHILVFDSGVGGLSVLQAIRQQLPSVQLTYASDNGFFPYGTKTEDILLNRIDKVLSTTLMRFPVDMLVIACNTASTLALPLLRSKFSLPIVGVVPAIKPAAEQSQSKVIGLLATPATITRPYTQRLIQDFAKECEVISLGSSALVEMAELKLQGHNVDKKALATEIDKLLSHPNAKQMDRLVLACTHFPLLADELIQMLPESIQLLDSGEAIARRVSQLLGPIASQPNAVTLEHQAVFTSQTPEIMSLLPAMTAFGIRQHYVLDV